MNTVRADVLAGQLLRQGQPVSQVDELVEVRAAALYRVVYLMERGGKREDRTQAAASLRSWLGLVDA